MSEEVVQLTAADWDEGLAFLNEVFGEHHEHNFATLLPSIYQPTEDLMSCNHAVRVDGRIRAVVGLFPLHWHVGATQLKVGGIGGVSTHSTVRGKGYMKVLMNHCVEKMQTEGYHLSWLGGQRQRYGYFGFEKCGQQLSVSLTAANVRHVFGDKQPLRFEPIENHDMVRIGAARQLHDAQLVHCSRGRTDEFPRFLASWYHRPHAALDAAGTMVGYLVADEEGSNVLELLACDTATAVDIARSWVQAHDGNSVRLDIPVTQFELLQQLSAIGESVSVGSSGNWQIYDWAATVAALLQVRVTGGALADGDVVIGIEGYGNLHIQVEGTQITCAQVTDKAAVTWDAGTAMRVLFGPLPPSAVTWVPPAAAPLLAWCPLPLGWRPQDGV
jgi:predicted N-acetyltransferase YhbS